MPHNSSRRILVLDGHPDEQSFCAHMARDYAAGAKSAGHEVDVLAVRDLSFDPVLHYGYRQPQELEPDLLQAQERIRRCQHLVVVMPVWWGGLPGLFKGFIDRTFLSGFSHRFNPQTRRPVGMLKGRSASVLYTQGAPWFYSLMARRDSFWHVLEGSILRYCGFGPVRRRYFDKVKSGTDDQRRKILHTVRELGGRGF